MFESIEFPTHSAACDAGRIMKRSGRAITGYVSGPTTGKGGALIYRAHIRTVSGERCIHAGDVLAVDGSAAA